MSGGTAASVKVALNTMKAERPCEPPVPAADGSPLPWGSTSGCVVTVALGVSTGAGGHGWMGCQACEGPPALAGKRQESYPIRGLLRLESTLLS